ncbi:teleost multiple tissue opsin b isoform X1 [Ictalurus punctatus]|uniref:Teleost multiple tissue opsin b isoform X1 n=1 Tax=Ictalurus punctatus TaxID=7998 RepID=A0A2D0PSZ3_ICTPU|nr:teleost multiple tissue opsin b isoform X1 [Ictalurus punctatus]
MDYSSVMIASNLSRSCASCSHFSGTHAPLERDLSPAGHVVVTLCLGFIGTFGFLNNALVLLLFCRHKPLRSPINCMLVSISVSDLLVCVLGTPFSFAASARGRWLIGARGCVWYGFINSFLGIVSLISMASLSYERYCTMMRATQVNITSYRKVFMGIAFSWIYSLMWAVPPLFGWSHYGPEGPGTTCSVNWTTRTANNMSYIVCLFFFCLILPFVVIVYSYGKLLQAIKKVMRINTALSRKREQRVLLLVVTMVVCYLLCWLPYGIMALVATFGEPGLVTPEASIVPSLLAKMSTVINPVIYIFMNKQFYRGFRNLLTCTSSDLGSNYQNSSKVIKSLRIFRRANVPSATPHQDVACNPDRDKPKSGSEPETRSPAVPGTAKPIVSLVVYYNG